MSGCELLVRVQPRSSQNRIELQPDGSLKVWTTAPPVDGAANEALCEILAKRLKIAPSRISIVSGATGRNKRIRVEGLEEADVRVLLQPN